MADGADTKLTPWWQIIAILVGVAVVTGLTLGLLREALGLSAGNATVAVGAAVGGVGAILIGRRRALQAQQQKK
ncbi:MAG: hypothetical protein IT370_22530 [Deltaproteobacteria bacterium]|nr:hypothetical protein [Deltaproteobacteria bacterium]